MPIAAGERLYSRWGLPVALMFHPFNYAVAACAYLLQFNIFSAMRLSRQLRRHMPHS